MESTVREVIDICHEKLLLYHDLLTLFRKERKSIINADVSALWRHSSEKQEMAERLMAIRKSILTTLEKGGVRHGMTEDEFNLENLPPLFGRHESRIIREHIITISRVKNQVKVTAEANKKFIDEYLKTINELVNVVAGNDKNTALYNQRKNFHRTRNQENSLIYREV